MIQVVSIAAIILGCIALLDRRAWSLLAILALAWLWTAFADAYVKPTQAVALKPSIDMSCGLLAIAAVSRRRELWERVTVACFACMLIAHGLYWSAWASGFMFWVEYAYVLTGLFLAQFLAVSYPGGGVLVRNIGDWAKRLGHVRSRGLVHAFGPEDRRENDDRANRHADVGAGRHVFISPKRRA